MSESSTRWITVSQAAAALGISDRAIQKRCALGKLAARRIETPQGTRWEIDANQITRTDEPNARTLDANQRTKSPELPELSREPANHADAFHAQNHANLDANRHPNQRTEPREPDANHANAQAELHAHLVEENRFLRGLVEQHQRSEAELRAALRKALEAMPKAITAGESSTRNDAETSRENAPQAPINAATGKQAQDEKSAAQSNARREMRPLWKVILGVR